MSAGSVSNEAFVRLRGFLQADSGPVQGSDAAVEQCELCSIRLHARHRHLLNMHERDLVCACDPCALRFQNVVGGRFRLIPRDARVLKSFVMTDSQWASLAVPIDLVFVYRDSVQQRRVALYPSAAGVTESLLSPERWDELASNNPLLNEIEDDVEALLINRVHEPPLYFTAPVDTCYELSGLIRVHWRGLSGGERVWQEVGRFFDDLTRHARHA